MLAAHTVAVAVDDLRSRSRPLQVVFNAGQYCLALLAARWTWCALTGTPVLRGFTPFHGSGLIPALAAGAVFAVVNDGLVSVVVALAGGQPVRSALAQDLGFKLGTAGLLVALAPIAASVLKESVLMLPLLVLPILSVGRAANLAVAREQESLHDAAHRAPQPHPVPSCASSAALGSTGVAVICSTSTTSRRSTTPSGTTSATSSCASRWPAGCAAGVGRERHRDRPGVVARLGGDEFAVLLTGDAPLARAEAFAEQLLAGFAQPVEVQGTRLSVHTSIGITTSDAGPLGDVHTALKQADIALYEAKQERARARVFDPATMTAAAERVRLLPQLQEAIEAGQLRVHYQPQVDAHTGHVVGVEALVRWQHPVEGLLPPAAFIDLAESSGLVIPLTTFVLRESLAAVRRWRALGVDVGVSVNLSARQLSDLDLPAHVAGLLAEAGVPASALTVEVTESSLMTDTRAARAILGGLREMGVQLSIDDFGTGWSSLALLQQLDVDELKVDRGFVQGMETSPHDQRLVRSVVELAHSIGLSVVAEGVETGAVAARLAALGCERLQGYLFGRPMPAEDLEGLLRLQAGKTHDAGARPAATVASGGAA